MMKRRYAQSKGRSLTTVQMRQLRGGVAFSARIDEVMEPERKRSHKRRRKIRKPIKGLR
ncbi:MAG: hypothetical protein QF645_11245 [Planctomycetota bacterium]|nr:hypothetical protein [Planctomycetota bacterium]